jgi:hypothetical protein
MPKSILSELWEEYLHTSPTERPQLALEAAEILIEQGSELEYRAFLSVAIEDAMAIFDTQVAVNATVELARHLVFSGRHVEAVEILTNTVGVIEIWRSLELGILYRAIAWTYRESDQPSLYEDFLARAIHHFRSLGLTDWYIPLENELGLAALEREGCSALAVGMDFRSKSWSGPS